VLEDGTYLNTDHLSRKAFVYAWPAPASIAIHQSKVDLGECRSVPMARLNRALIAAYFPYQTMHVSRWKGRCP
jgi:hypothetical protein